MKIRKNLKKCVELIEFYNSLDKNDISFCNYDKRNMSSFLKEGDKFILETDEKFDGLSFDNMSDFDINNKEYKLSNNIGLKILDSHLFNTNLLNLSKFRVYRFSSLPTDNNSDSGYLRLIMNHTKDKFNLDAYFEGVLSIETDLERSFFNGVEISINNTEIIAYYSDNYFILESKNRIDKRVFEKLCYSVITALGFITGYSPGNYGYFFNFPSKDFSDFTYYEFSSSFVEEYDNRNYSVIDTNIYNYVSNLSKDERDSFVLENKDKLCGVSKKSLSTLCEKLLENENFLDGVHCIIEARKSSLTAMGVLYSVSLESLSNLISEDNKEKIYLIKAKNYRKELCKKLKKTAKEYLNNKEIVFEESSIDKRIENINAPTNRDKLTQVFKLLEIPISEDDLEIINMRNKFLHGTPLYNIKDNIDDSSKNLWNIALRFNFLVNAIVFKYIGHTGYIKNLSGLYEVIKKQQVIRSI